MPVLDLYSDRKRRADGLIPDVLTYDLPDELRVQIIYILKRGIGEWPNLAWTRIHDMVAEGHGRFELARGPTDDQRCINFVLHEPSVDRVHDLIEISFRFIDVFLRNFDDRARREYGIDATATASIERLNERFRRAGVGYRFEDGNIIRVDSELIHSEVVRPALRFLNGPGFQGPREEFLRAHACYRGGAIPSVSNPSPAAQIGPDSLPQTSLGWPPSRLAHGARSRGGFSSPMDRRLDKRDLWSRFCNAPQPTGRLPAASGCRRRCRATARPAPTVRD